MAGSISRDLKSQRPRRRRQVWQEAELGTGVCREGWVRDCQPRRASARAGRLIFGGVSVVVVVVDVGGGGEVKKVGGRWVRMVSRLRVGGRRRLNS